MARLATGMGAFLAWLALLASCSAPGTPMSPSAATSPATAAPTATASTAPVRPPLPSPSSEPTPTPEGVLDPAALADGITVAVVERHLTALWIATRDHGGDRRTGSPGFDAALAHAAATFEAAGLEVALHPFIREGRSGTNLVAERHGRTDRGEVVMLGAHLDTVAGSPGMNDNASGVAVVLAIGEALAALPPPERTIRLAVWDAEENGPFGSAGYVAALDESGRAAIGAYLNLDMVGSPNALRLVYDEAAAAPGSDAVRDRLVAALRRRALAWEPIDLEGDSDHGPFSATGIPTGGLFSGGIEPVTEAQAARFGATAGVPADPCSHRPCDTMNNVDPATVAELGRVVAAVLAELAAEPEP